MADAANSSLQQLARRSVCLGCGCLCDDVELETYERSIIQSRNVCSLGRDWFESQVNEGTSYAFDSDALSKAAAILAASRFPIFLGIEHLTTEAQRRVIALAELTRGVVASDSCNAMVARQEVGEVTCTLGEIKSRADLVVFWFADPMKTHPRHLERYSADCVGRFVSNGRNDRFLIVVDETPTATSAKADWSIHLSADGEFSAIEQLRLQIRKPDLGAPATEQASPNPCSQLADQMKRAKYGVFVVDPGRRMSASVPIESLFKLVRDLNSYTCWVVAPLGAAENAKGAETVLQWLTGFPSNVSFAGDEPGYNGSEFSAEEQLKRGRPDAAIIFGSWASNRLSTTAAEHLKRIPKVRIGGVTGDSDVHLASASWLESSGTLFRMDGVPLPIDAIFESKSSPVELILEKLTTETKRLIESTST